MNNNNRRGFLKQSVVLLGGILLGSNKIYAREVQAFNATEPFLGQVSIFSFPFAPKGWALCNGQLLPINQNQALFSLLGTTYGGDGRVNFALPDLRGRVPIHEGNNHTLGERGGEQAHTLNISELPAHSHAGEITAKARYGVAANQESPIGALPGLNPAYSNRFANSSDEMMALSSTGEQPLAAVGGNQAHLNMQPFLVLNFCISLQGIFPSPN
ncbi:phage tail protein [Sphingobacterium paucimobilis]|uniref:Phage tail collar domain-containing protein n=1 Tax=Sphingobacterium paucimobilis HER1398 TaxID=1346330 RepID=U2J8N4_9SPHI|nr:tail fiber protein [Sphingobacterium paucimobilis]ERJ61299.1 hypothetical protein M472_21325 [Sphingobacterium paucimobilis HER1398]